MSKSEKRYFTLDAKKAGKTNAKYLELFKMISKMEVYDEVAVRAKFKGHLSVDKAYLYDAILKSMRDYHSKKSRAAQIKAMLLDAKYLFERELYDLCEERLNQAKKLAKSLHDHLSLLMITREERQLVHKLKGKDFEQNLIHVTNNAKQVRAIIAEEYEVLDLYDTIWSKRKRFTELEPLERQELKSAVSQLPAQDFHSNVSQWRYYRSEGLLLQIEGREKEAFEYYSNALKWWDENPHYKAEEYYNYVGDVTNFLMTCFRQSKFEEFISLVRKLETNVPENSYYQKLLFQMLMQLKLFYCINRGEIQETKATAKIVENGLNKYAINLSKEKILITNTAILQFISGYFEDCIIWCDKLLKLRTTIRSDTNRGIYFLKLISLFELDELDRFENTVRSCRRFLRKDQHTDMSNFLQMLKLVNLLMEREFFEQKELLTEIKLFIEAWREQLNDRVDMVGVEQMIHVWVKSKLGKTTIVSELHTN